MDFKLSETNCGNKSLSFYDYTLHYSKALKSGFIFWSCSVKSCKTTIKTDSESTSIAEVEGEHYHELDERKVEQQQLRVSVKWRAAEDITARSTKVIQYVQGF